MKRKGEPEETDRDEVFEITTPALRLQCSCQPSPAAVQCSTVQCTAVQCSAVHSMFGRGSPPTVQRYEKVQISVQCSLQHFWEKAPPTVQRYEMLQTCEQGERQLFPVHNHQIQSRRIWTV